jgi:hypothetical protein
MEEFNTSEEKYDAVLFFDVLHHVVDENMALANCFKVLKKGGLICIHEGAWNPGNMIFEKTIELEMQTYGTLENPFTIEYLDFCLKSHGFKYLERYNTIHKISSLPLTSSLQENKDNNFVLARKPWENLTTIDEGAITSGSIEIVDYKVINSLLNINICIKNTGKSVWLVNPNSEKGWVTIALLNKNNRIELGRRILNKIMCPNDEVFMQIDYFIDPSDFLASDLCLDLVNENLAWFGLNVLLDHNT